MLSALFALGTLFLDPLVCSVCFLRFSFRIQELVAVICMTLLSASCVARTSKGRHHSMVTQVRRCYMEIPCCVNSAAGLVMPISVVPSSMIIRIRNDEEESDNNAAKQEDNYIC